MSEGNINIIIADDHKMFRDGISYVLEKIKGVKVIGEASTGEDVLNLLKTMKPDIILMDISMPVLDGIQATKKITAEYPELKVIALSMFGDQDYYYKMIQSGAKGFLLKESGKDELEQAIFSVSRGENYFSQELLRKIIFNMGQTKYIAQDEASNIIKLTSRELDVLKLTCRGLSNQEISDKLFISTKTVEGHKTSLLNKTNTRNTASLIVFAIKNKLVDL
ncbi:MAG: response regulator transcription factor [Bacteroidales bacterium]|nr:response regulator transcription factor [Bacteroidales bacterium]MBN2818728.1 response regulator transcription factor [Bacteroidales bacterium]